MEMNKRVLVKTIVWLSLLLIISWVLTFAFKNHLSELAYHTLFLLEGIFTLFLLPAAIYTIIGAYVLQRKVEKTGQNETLSDSNEL